MDRFQNNDLDFIAEDYYNVTDSDDFHFEGADSPRSCVNEYFDSDFEDDFELSKSKTDTSAFEARNGKDMQGIPWDRLNFTRNKYREMRCKQYRNYENLPFSGKAVLKEGKQVEKGHGFYDFNFNTKLVKPTIVHFQIIYNCQVSHPYQKNMRSRGFISFGFIQLIYFFMPSYG